ncbi:protein kinase domain-containing protein [Gordonia sp. DT219]|uniref:protein kinase domain-containing protein n=1 Tax=Gordonia sp. DT219 TaxID=3416658 RepID=UPI003CFB5857
MALTVGQEFAGYRIIRVLGAGGMGEVYLARHPRLPRRDALKVLPANLSSDEAFRRRFTREADLAAGLDHPNVVDVYDRGESDGQLWITMRYVEGQDGAELLSSRPGGLPGAEVAHIVTAVADALDHAHAQNLLHRDVKPANVLLTEATGPTKRRRVLLADFGIARPILEETRLTATNLTVGSFAYSSPEQLAAEKLDGRADEYSLACTAYQLLSGATPFANTNVAALIRQQMSEPPPPITTRRPDLSRRVDQVLGRALEKDPARRYRTCSEFAADLDAALTTTPAAPTVTPAPVGSASSPHAPAADPGTPVPLAKSKTAGHSALPPASPGVTPPPYAPPPNTRPANTPPPSSPGRHNPPPPYSPPYPAASYAVTSYGAPAAYPPAPNRRADNQALWSLICALVSFVGSCLFGVGGIILGGVAIYFGTSSLRLSRAQQAPGTAPTTNKRGLAIAGIAVGVLGLLFSVVMLIGFIATA